MNKFYLPNPDMMVVPQPHVPDIKPELIQLAPIRQATPEHPKFQFAAPWRPSVSPNFSSSQSSPPTSMSASPAFSYSGLEPPYKSTVQPYPYYEPPESRIRCSRCLERSETVWVTPGTNCPRCNTPAHDGAIRKLHAPGKTSMKKRVDRKKYSRMHKTGSNATKPEKRDGEAGRRFDHAWTLALLQQTLLSMNPELAQKTAGSLSNKKRGWSPLKKNNICWDVKKEQGIEPLLYNKMDIFATSILMHEQSNDIINDTLAELKVLHDASYMPWNPKPTCRFADMIKRITKATETRGGEGWCLPSQFPADVSSRL